MNALDAVQQNDICSLRIICNLARNNKEYNIEEVDRFGNTALLKACYLGRDEAASTLISFGANLKAINFLGQNALTLATYSGNINLVHELLKHRSYDDFNLSSIIPAACVAALCQNQGLLEYFKTLNTTFHPEEIQSVHGLSSDDLLQMISGPNSNYNDLKNLRV